MKILIVDDDKMGASFFQKRLVKKGYEVELETKPSQVIARVESGEYNLILLDIIMPEVTGMELLEKLRSKYDKFQMPILMVTAKDEVEDVVEALRMGANDYLVKPVNIEIATARIQTQLSILELAKENENSKKLEAVNAMAGTYNHEINNPLAIAMASLSRPYEKIEEKHVNIAMDAIERIAEIVKKISEVRDSELNFEDYGGTGKIIKVK